MAEILVMNNGHVIIPKGLFDVLDVVQEFMGTDIREYLEEWYENEQPELGENEQVEAMQDHYHSVLEYIEGRLIAMQSEKKSEREETMCIVQALLRRELDSI